MLFCSRVFLPSFLPSFLPHLKKKNPHQIGWLFSMGRKEEAHHTIPLSIVFFISFLGMATAAAGSSSDSVGSGFGGESEMTPLQKHVAFFDRNNDGVIYPSETYQGFRAIGCGVALSSAAALLINSFIAPKTRTGIFQSPLFPIYVKNIKKGKHGSDSGVYDTEGRFVPENFEEIFHKHAHTNANALTSEELIEMLKSNRVPNDFQGWIASRTEWMILFSLCKDKNGLLQKETVRAVYDGSLFLQMEKDRSFTGKRA